MDNDLQSTDIDEDIVMNYFNKISIPNNLITTELVQHVPRRFSDAVNSILSQRYSAVNPNILGNRIRLAHFIKKFHSDAGSMNDAIEHRISHLSNPSTKIFVSTHQPNLFAYGGVFKKIILLETLKNTLEQRDQSRKIVTVFLLIDHDFLDENWIRLAQLPSLAHSSGLLQLRFPMTKSKRWQMVCNVALPSKNILQDWKHQLVRWIGNSAPAPVEKQRLLANLEKVWEKVELAYSRARTYSDLNSFLISLIANQEWKYDLLFVRLSEISGVFKDAITFLVSNNKMYSDVLKNTEDALTQQRIDTGVSAESYLMAPIWIHCACGSKGPAKISNVQQDLVLTGRCVSCKKGLEVNFGNKEFPDVSTNIYRLSPKAISIPILLSKDLGITCYASGTGGLGYMVDFVAISRHFGIPRPLIVAWPSKDISDGIGQKIALLSRKKINNVDPKRHLFELIRRNSEYKDRIRLLVNERTKLIRENRPIQEILEKVKVLKDEQDLIQQNIELAEKINNIVNLSPCILDYAINYGIPDTEKQWSRHLLVEDDLTTAVVFAQKNT